MPRVKVMSHHFAEHSLAPHKVPEALPQAETHSYFLLVLRCPITNVSSALQYIASNWLKLSYLLRAFQPRWLDAGNTKTATTGP